MINPLKVYSKQFDNTPQDLNIIMTALDRSVAAVSLYFIGVGLITGTVINLDIFFIPHRSIMPADKSFQKQPYNPKSMITEAKIRDYYMNVTARIVRGFQIRRSKKRFKRAVKLAIEKHRTDGKTYYVIQGDGIYKVWNSDQINRMRKAGTVYKRVTCLDVFEKASYTASSNKNLRGISMKEALRQEYKRIDEVL